MEILGTLIDMEFFTKKNITVFCIAILLLFASISLETSHGPIPQGVEGQVAEGFWSLGTLATFARELGIAFVVALIITVSIEVAARKEFNDTIDERMTQIQKNVFRSTYGRNIPPALVDEVDNLILSAKFIRKNHRATYRLKVVDASSLDEKDPTLPSIKVVIAEVLMSYSVENISTLKHDFPIRIELEKPPFAALKRFTQIQSVTIDKTPKSPADVAAGDDSCPDSDGFKCFEDTVRDVAPGQSISVQTSCRIIKSIDDIEIWRSIYPSDGMTLCVHFPSEATEKGAHALHRTDLTPLVPGDDNYFEWQLNEAVLPHQGIVFWWRISAPGTVGMGNDADQRPV